MATKKQLASLKKARAVRKKNLAKKAKKTSPPKRKKIVKRKSSATRKRPTKRKVTPKKKIKRNPTQSLVRWVFTQKGKSTRYYLQKINGQWEFDSRKPPGMNNATFNDAMRIAKRFIKRLPSGYHIYVDLKKKG